MIVKIVKAVKAIEYVGLSLNKKLKPSLRFLLAKSFTYISKKE
jgi:hypothetical protein